MNTTYEEKKSTKALLVKSKIFLNNNFHKFSQGNKIKIALALILKEMPIQFENDNPPQINVFIKNIIQKAGVDDKSRAVGSGSTKSQARFN